MNHNIRGGKMLKILIVDDEIFTREGIIEQLSWSKLNINEIRQAFDGVNALEIASSYRPDILLTDVRMPRMDGIELSFKLRETCPSCEIIFMSGYSDKEYLKSAIKLKAISYVEKPIDLEELEAAIKSAVSSKSKELEIIQSTKSNIAAELIRKSNNTQKLKELLGDVQFHLLSNTDFITVIFTFTKSIDINKPELISYIEDSISKSNFNAFSYFSEDKQIIFHLYSNDKKNNYMRKDAIHNLCLQISQHLSEYGRFFICIGMQVAGIHNVIESYASALSAFNKTFYYNYGSIVYENSVNHEAFKFKEIIIEDLFKYLSAEDKHQSILLIKRLTSEIKNYANTPVNYVKDIYYRLFTQLIKFSAQRNIEISENTKVTESLFESFISFSTIYEIEEHIIEKLEKLFQSLEIKNKNIDPISNILRYVHENYNDLELSLPKISKNTYLSPTYICKIFKDQTGTTINRYISEYRLEKAKDLLKDQNITINDISAKVGYSDGNYFTKTFKKETGLTPSEYRKKFLS
jgi:two-component system response regulator YesN